MPATISVKDSGGSNVTVATNDALATILGEVQASPTSNTVLDRLKAIATALGGTLAVADPGTGGTTDAAATAGGTGSVSAKLRLMTSQLNTLAGYLDSVESLLAAVASETTLAALSAKLPGSLTGGGGVKVGVVDVLPAGSNRIGKTTVRNAADSADIDPLAEATFTGRLGEVQTNPTTNTVLARLKDLLTGIVLAAGANKIGVVTTDQTTHGTTDLVAADITKVAGSAIAQGHGTAAAAVRVELPTDGTGVVGLNAGTNTIGGVKDVAATSGGADPYHLISAATTNATSVKASAGQLFGVQLTNKNTSNPAYVKFYDKASAPTVGTDTPKKVFTLPAAASASQPTVLVHGMPKGVAFGTGIAFAVTGGLANNDTTAVAAGDVCVDIDYK